MTHESPTKTSYTVVLRDQQGVLMEIDRPTRGDALTLLAEMRSDRSDETLELVTTEVFQ